MPLLKRSNKMTDRPYPSTICHPCAIKNGGKPVTSTSTMTRGRCGVCQQPAIVSEPRDYGYPEIKGHVPPLGRVSGR